MIIIKCLFFVLSQEANVLLIVKLFLYTDSQIRVHQTQQNTILHMSLHLCSPAFACI